MSAALAKGTRSGHQLASAALPMKFVLFPVVAALMAALLASPLVPVTNAAYANAAYTADPSEWRAPGPARKQSTKKAEKKRKAEEANPQAGGSNSTSIDSPRLLTPQGQQVYRIGTGDKLKVTIYNSEKLSGEYPVGGDGKIGLPMLGRVAVSGLTLDEVTTLLVGRLANGYFLTPNVTVDMAEYRPVYILGEVQKPGQYPYAEGMTVYRLVAQAGGYS